MPPVARPGVYVGPRPFRRGEPLFGRDREVIDLTNLLLAERVVLLYSPSGAGKTSLIQAGLVPRLRPDPAGGATRRPRPRVFDVPTVHPSIDGHEPAVAIRVHLPRPAGLPASVNRYVLSALGSLETRKPVDQQPPPEKLAELTLTDYLAREFPEPAAPTAGGSAGPSRPPFLIFDQFEEVLTQDPTDTAAKREFFRQLGEALADRGRWALIAVREDHLAALDPYRLMLPNRLIARYRLGRLGPEAALEAIENPARGTDLEFDPDAARSLVENLRRMRVQQGDEFVTQTGPDVEPVHLQVVCKSLWEMDDAKRAVPGRITAKDFETLAGERTGADPGTAGAPLAGVDAILAGYYRAKVAEAAGAVSERQIRDWFERELITRSRTRKPVLSAEHPWHDLPRDEQRLGVLSGAYLVREDYRAGTRWLELAHDRLIEPVLRDNARWREDNLAPFQRAAATWAESRARPDELLVGGAVLAWGEAHEAELTADERAFLQASRDLAARRWVRLRNRLGAATVGVLVGLAIVVGAAYQNHLRALSRQKSAVAAELRGQEEVRDRWRQGAQVRLRVIGNWAWEAEGDGWSPPSAPKNVRDIVDLLERAWGNGVELPGGETILRQAVQRLGWRGLMKSDGPVRAVAFSPTGRWLAVGGAKDLAVWNLAADLLPAKPVWRLSPPNAAALAFAPDDAPDESQLWVGAMPTFSGVRSGWLYRLRLPALKFQLVRSLTATDIQTVFAIPGRAADEGGWVVTVTAEGSGHLWPWRPGSSLVDVIPLNKPGGGLPSVPPVRVTAVGFAPGSSRVYAGTYDGRVLAWDLSNPDPVVRDTGVSTGAAVTTLAVHPKGDYLAVGSFRSGTSLWPMSSPTEIAPNWPWPRSSLGERSAGVVALTFHPSGDWLAVETRDRGVQLFRRGGDADRPYVPAALFDATGLDAVSASAFDPTPAAPGRVFLTGAPDGAVRVWDLGAAELKPFRLPGPPTKGVTAAALSPDRSRAVVGCEDGTVHLWDLWRATGRAGAEPRVLSGLPSARPGAAVSPDGRLVAVVDQRANVWVWELDRPDPVARKFESLVPVPDIAPVADRPPLLFDNQYLTALIPELPPTRWDLTRPDPKPEAAPGLVPPPETGWAVVTPDHRWVISLADAEGGTAELLVRGVGSPEPSRYPIPVSPHPAPPGTPRVGYLNRIAVDGPDPVLGGKALTLAAAVQGQLRAWRFDPESGRTEDPIPLAAPPVGSGRSDPYTAIAVSPDGRRVVAGTSSGTIHLWDLPAGEWDRSRLSWQTGQLGLVTALAFSPDGSRFVSGADDGTVIIWDPRRRADWVTLSGHTTKITTLLFSRERPPPNGTGALRLVTVSEDGTARVWTFDRGALIARAKELVPEAPKK
jgi:WD40 repeat protein